MKKLLSFLIASALAVSAFAVDLNKASRAELEALKGLGPKIVQNILTEREKKPFTSFDDFSDRVNRVGPKLVASLQKQGLTLAPVGKK